MKTVRLDFIFASVFLVSFVLLFTMYKFFGFEIAVLFSLCLISSLIAISTAGLENVIKLIGKRIIKDYER